MRKIIQLPLFLLWFLPSSDFAQVLKSKTHAVYFESEKYLPNSTEKAVLIQFLKSLDSLAVRSVSIAGFCDDLGANPFNDSLSVWRARTVKQIVAKAGHQVALLKEVKGGGEIAFKKNQSERAKNRRVDIVVSYTGLKKTEIEEKKTQQVLNAKQSLIDQKPSAPQEIFNSESKVGDKIVLQYILFQSGYHYVLPESNPQLNNLLQKLRENPQNHILILGHVCCEKPGQDSMDFGTGIGNLSEARAKTIYDFLISNGIDKNRLAYKGMKSDYKLGLGEKYDKRVEIEITKITE